MGSEPRAAGLSPYTGTVGAPVVVGRGGSDGGVVCVVCCAEIRSHVDQTDL